MNKLTLGSSSLSLVDLDEYSGLVVGVGTASARENKH